MTTPDEMEGLIGEHEPDVAYEAPGDGRRPPPERGSARVFDPDLILKRTRGRRFLINGRVEVEITVCRHTPPRGLPLWIASAWLETPRGPLQWAASATEHEVARKLAAQHGIAGFDLGELFGGANGASNQRATQRGAQGLAFQRVVGDIRRTFDSPAGQGVMTVLSAIPYVGPAVQGVRAATTIVDNVMQGDARSRANLSQLQRSAQRGDPAARQAVGVVENVLRAQRRMAVSRTRGPRRPPPRPGRTRSAEEERAWRLADARWNEYRAERARENEATPEPLIPPAPRGGPY